jgi:hypothetical protein
MKFHLPRLVETSDYYAEVRFKYGYLFALKVEFSITRLFDQKK